MEWTFSKAMESDMCIVILHRAEERVQEARLCLASSYPSFLGSLTSPSITRSDPSAPLSAPEAH